MYLRAPALLKKLYAQYFDHIQLKPLLSISPPYQTGFQPIKKTLGKLKKMELESMRFPLFNYIADQVVVVGEKII